MDPAALARARARAYRDLVALPPPAPAPWLQQAAAPRPPAGAPDGAIEDAAAQ